MEEDTPEESFRIWFRHSGQDPVDLEDVRQATTKSCTWSEVKTQVGSYQLTHLKLEGTIPKNIGEIASHAVCLVLRKITDKESLNNLSQLTQLEILDIGHNTLNTVPDVVSSLTSLKQLDMTNCRISSLPGSLSQLTQLEILDIGMNTLNTVPEVVSSLTSLKQLNVENCCGFGLPDSLFKFPQFETTKETPDIEDNSLNTAPDVVSSLKKNRPEIFGIIESLRQLTQIETPEETPEETADIEDNSLNTVPDVVSSLKQLMKSRSGIFSLPESLSQLTQLEMLDIGHNTLKTVPDVVSSLTSLKQLNMSVCRISSLPESLSQLTQLEKLDIGWNPLNTVPDVLSSLTSLKQLIMIDCEISSLPESLSQLTQLEILDIAWNSINRVPEVVSSLTSLKKLNMSHCSGFRLPESRHQLTQLVTPDIEDNSRNTAPHVVSSLKMNRSGIFSLPESFSHLTQLEILDIGENPLNTVPDVVSSLTSLKQLNMSNCGISSLPESFSQLTQLEILDIGGNTLNTVPDVVSSHRSLKQLKMNFCRISSLPESFSQLTQLEILDIGENTLNTVPDFVSSLTSLKQLNMNGCGISSLPESLSQLTQLEILDIRDNSLNTVPGVVSSLTSLKQLNMNNCGISSLPESIVSLSNLQHLDISNRRYLLNQKPKNQITCLPDNLSQLSSLGTLDLSGNDNLKVLTPEIADMPLLTIICADGCESLTSPPYGVCQQGAGAIKQYYTDIRNHDSVKVSMVTVAVIGQTMSGKTSLIKTLQSTDRTRVLTQRVDGGSDDDTTAVFKMEDVCVDNDVLRFIDFGGHEIYQSTYRFTLKPNCILIVVVSLKQYEDMLHEDGGDKAVRRLYFDWLSHLYLAYPKLGPPKLVLTHLDKIDESELEEIKESFFYHSKFVFEIISRKEKSKWEDGGAFATIEHFEAENMFKAEDIYEVGNVYCEAFIQLKERLLRESKQFVKAIPTTWVEVEQALNKFEKGYKPFQDIFSQFSSSISLTEKQFDIILTYMHNCGMLLWYKDDKDLRPYIFYHIPTVTSLLQVLFTHDDTVWKRRESALTNSTSAVQQLLTLDKYKSFASEFASKGEMHHELFKHLLRTETDFKENAAIRVAAKILQSFQIMYHSKKNFFHMPYFCKEILSDSLPNKGSCATFHAQLRFHGLPLPQYAYHQLAVDMLNSFSQDSDSITARNNGARVVNNDVTYQLVHDYKLGIVNIRVSFDFNQVCRAWEVLVDITNSSIEYIETRWCACKIGCKFFCAHCGLEKCHCPSSIMNPSWVNYRANRGKSPLHSSKAKDFTCEKDPSVPKCLLNPITSLSEGQKEEFSKFLNNHEQSSSSEDDTQVESDAESDISDHEDFFHLGEDPHIKVEVSVTKKEKIKQLFYSNKVYRMSETVRGRALIINYNFPDSSQLTRTGSEVDVKNIEAVLKGLNFEVDVKDDKTAENMLEVIKEETQHPDNEDYGMHVTVLMSHGATYGAYGMLYGADLKPVKLLDVFDLLSSDNFKSMDGKPKVVIVVACRNVNISAKPAENSDKLTEEKRNRLHMGDMLILQSCLEGRKSLRDESYGTPIIRELVKTLYKHSSHRDLATLFDISTPSA